MSSVVTRNACRAIFALFLAALWLPVLEWLRPFESYPPPYERRELAATPQRPADWLALMEFPSAFENFFNDHFGLRNTLIHWNSVARARGLGMSSNERMLLGKDNWIFLGYPEALNTYRVIRPLDEGQLADLETEVARRAQWCAKRGIKYLDVWLPEKQGVYPEYLPGWVRPVHEPDNLTRYIQYVEQAGRVPVLNLAQALKQARMDQQIFYSGDSHWNSHGAYAGYLAIAQKMKSMGVPLRTVTRDDLQTVRMEKVGDVSEMLNLEAYYVEQCDELRFRRPASTQAAITPKGPYTLAQHRIHAYEHQNKRLPRLVMFADSFGYEIIPFFAESFSRAVYVRNPGFNEKILEQERPDIVLELHVARHLESEKPRGAVSGD